MPDNHVQAPRPEGRGGGPQGPATSGTVLARLRRVSRRWWRRGVEEIAQNLESGDRIAQLHALRGVAAVSGRQLRWLEPSLLRLLASAEDEVQREARRALRAVYSLEEVRRRLERGSPEERAAAVRVLGALRHESTIALLFEQAAEEEAPVRDAAVAELIAIGDEQVICGAIEALQSDEPSVHGAAVHVLRAMGPGATSLLVHALGAPGREVRFGAVKALEAMRASAACPHLAALLQDPVDEIRAQAARVLAAMRYREALPQLIERALGDPAQSVRMEAATALAVVGEAEAVRGLLTFLRRGSEDLSFEVADQDFLAAVAAMPDLPASGYQAVLEGENQPFAISLALALEDAGTVNRWLLSLPEADAAERQTLMSLLQSVARLGVREPFMEGLALPDAELRGASAWLLGNCGHSEAVPALIGLLADTEATVRRRAVEALGEIRDTSCGLALAGALGDPDREVRAAAIAALAGMVESGAAELALAAGEARQAALPPAEPAPSAGSGQALSASKGGGEQAAQRSPYSLPARVTDVLGGLARTLSGSRQDNILSGASALARALHDPADNVRAQVSEALGRLGIDSAAHDLLDRALHDASSQVRANAARALGKLNASEVAPALIKSLQHHDPDLRRRAAEALGELGDPLAGPALIVALEDPAPPVRQAAARSLWQIADSSLVEPLREHLHNPDPKIRAAVAGTLGKLGAATAADAIAGRLEDPNKYVRAAALNALANIGEQAQSLQPRVARIMRDSDPFVRSRAAHALVRMGDPGSEEVRLLLAALQDPAQEVRRAARASLVELANSGAVAAMANALRDDDHRDQVRGILLETNLAVMRSLLTAARQADDRLGRLLLDIVSQVLRERGSIEDCRRELCSLDPTVRLAGLEALGLMRTPEAIELITSVVFDDPLPALREKAALMLGELDDPVALAALRRAREVLPLREGAAEGS